MYIFLYPDGKIDVTETWEIEFKPPIGTLIYEPSDSLFPWSTQCSNGPQGISESQIPKEAKAIEMLYPRTTSSDPLGVRGFTKQTFKG